MPNSAYELLQKRIAGKAAHADDPAGGGGGGILGQLGAIVGTIFGTNSRGRLSTGQVIARDVARSVTNTVVGGIAAKYRQIGGRQDGRFDWPLGGARHARRGDASLNLVQ